MSESVKISAPGKLMLFGEHAVIYDHPCIVTAISKRASVKVSSLENAPYLLLDAPDLNIFHHTESLKGLGDKDAPKGVQFVETAVKNFAQVYGTIPGIHVETSSFSSDFGLGSSSAVTVCVIKGLTEIFGVKFTEAQIFDLCYKTILEVQGSGSGFDVASTIYGGTLYFLTGGKTIEQIGFDEKSKDTTAEEKNFPLIVAYSGEKADTVSMIQKVSQVAQTARQEIFDAIGYIVSQGKEAVLKKDWKKVGELMDQNQQYLSKLGVSTPKLDSLITAAKNAGALGAKLSGAGGGDCMIAIVSDETKAAVTSALTSAGGQVIDVLTNADGVKLDF
ncbi:MAG TPA: mevalonate kinase [Candidatus Saccharimonadales bacterium]|nr:mevalonate kinase [Candidatus Saccharimonadales bacterium]